MAEIDDALGALARWLDEHETPYMVIGGFAVTLWGEPRFTRDVDLTLLVPPEKLEAVVNALCAAFTPLVADPLRFVTDTRVLPVMAGTVPADLIFAALPYEEHAIGRARKVRVGGESVSICTPEDLVLHKIVSPRPRDHEDIEGVFRYRHAELDYEYLDPRVEELANALADRGLLDWYRALRKRWS